MISNGRTKLIFALVMLSGLSALAAEHLQRAGEDAARLNCANSGYVHYVVPAMSNVMRLPDSYPADGEAGGTLRIVAAQDEYESASFVIASLRDSGKVRFEISDLKNQAGDKFPPGNLDLKVVKVWYQNRNGWFSYFADNGLKLVPELLLNDENLIHVDTVRCQNYARLADGRELWISAPLAIEGRKNTGAQDYTRLFSPMRPDFGDAATLQPVQLNKGEFKQFFLTAHVAADTPPGLYRGQIRLDGLGAIPVALRVLPFKLPSPRCYQNPEQEFSTNNYGYLSIETIMTENGGNRELARTQFLAVMKNLKSHNQNYFPLFMRDSKVVGSAGFLEEIKLMKQAGISTDPLFGGSISRRKFHDNNPLEIHQNAVLLREYLDRALGHHNVFIQFGDEPGVSWLRGNRDTFKSFIAEGFRFTLFGNQNVPFKAGHLVDYYGAAGDPLQKNQVTAGWNARGSAWTGWYAGMHVGAENPAFNRLQYGLVPYLAGFSATFNYAHHLGPYNDRNESNYKPMVFAYGTRDGVIDTLAWEGYREAVDDIRYATLFQILARRLTSSDNPDNVYAGRKGLWYLANLDPGRINAEQVRLEMINYILDFYNRLERK